MKNKKFIIFILMIICLSCTLLGVTACGDVVDEPSGKITLTFDKGFTDDSPSSVSYDIEVNEYFNLTGTNVVYLRDGYKFLGYFDSRFGGVLMFNQSGEQVYGINKSITLYAQWEALKYKKQFISDNNQNANVSELEYLEVSVEDVSIDTLPEPKMHEGYDFIGWSVNNTLITEGTDVKETYCSIIDNAKIWLNSQPLKAVYTFKTLTITLDYNDGSGNTEVFEYAYNDRVGEFEPLANDDENKIEFIGWSTEKYEFKDYKESQSLKNIKEDITLFAFWDRYKIVKFHKDTTGENYQEFKVYKDRDFEMPDLAEPGYKLVGWYRNKLFNSGAISVIKYTSGIDEVYGKFQIANYSITYDLSGGQTLDGETSIANGTYNIVSEFDLPVLTKDKHEFLGWQIGDGVSQDILTSITKGSYGDLYLIAKFKGHDRKVVYDAGDGNVYDTGKVIEYGTSYTLDVPTLEGYAFVGWYADEAFTTKLTNGRGESLTSWKNYSESTTVYAKYDKMYKVSITNGTDLAGVFEFSKSVNDVYEGGENYAYYCKGEKVTVKVTAIGKYLYKGLYEGNTKITNKSEYSFYISDSDVNLKAEYEVKTYTITLNTNGGSCSSTSKIVEAEANFSLPVSYKKGYTFIGWELPDYDIITDELGNSKITYTFTENITLVAFFIQGDSANDKYISNADELINIKNDTKATYKIVNNINMGGKSWSPFDFSGKLYGNGFTISNFTIRLNEGNVAMFNTLSGIVDGINFSNVNVISTSYTNVGVALICYNLNGGTISNCNILSGNIKGELGYAGGFACLMNGGSINNCENHAKVTTDSNSETDVYGVGGIVGYVNSGTINNCYNYGVVEGAEFVGGIFGRSKADSSFTFNNVSNYGQVTGSESYVGGIGGYYSRDYEYSVINIRNEGSVIGTNYVAGLIGKWENVYNVSDNSVRKLNITNAINTAHIIANGNYVGGLFGHLDVRAPYYAPNNWSSYDGSIILSLRQVENYGNVEGNYYVGGLSGYLATDTIKSTIYDGKSFAEITGLAIVGGLLGESHYVTLESPSNANSTIKATEVYNSNGVDYAYLGGYVGNAVNTDIINAVNNVKIDYSNYICKGRYVGGICGYLNGVLTDCVNYANVNALNSDYVGGVVGQFEKLYEYNISNVKNLGDVKGKNYVAGVFGSWKNVYNISDNEVRKVNAINVMNSGKIIGSGDYVAGLVGFLDIRAPHYEPNNWSSYDGSVIVVFRNPTNTGDITGKYYVGGLFGKATTDNNSSDIVEGKSKSNITANAYVGGIAGYLGTFNVTNTTNNGTTIKALGSYDEGSNKYAYLGGYIGYADNVNIINAINEVEISYKDTLCVGNYVGGICGYSKATFTDCENNAKVDAPNSSYVGGISGSLNKHYGYTIEDVKNTGDVKGKNYVAGVFGAWENVYNISDNDVRKVNAINVMNSGNIIGSGDYVAGLVGFLDIRAPHYVPNNWSSYDGSVIVVFRNPINTGDITGKYYVGGLFGKATTDNNSSDIIEGESKAKIVGNAYVGGIAGYLGTFNVNNTTNDGSTVEALSYVEESSKNAYLGGYIGYAENVNVVGVLNKVQINYKDTLCVGNYVGGICGYSTGTFTACENNAKVYAPNSDYVGGIAGSLNKIHSYKIETVTNKGDITGKNYVAGVFGAWKNVHKTQDNNERVVNATDIINYGKVVCTGNYAGGLVGCLEFAAPHYVPNNWSSYDGCQLLYMVNAVNSGNVIGVKNVGGLMGYCSTDSTKSKLYSYTQTGSVTGQEKYSNTFGERTNLILPN